jgi:hypothetical protein
MSDQQFALAFAFGTIEGRRGAEFVGGLGYRKAGEDQTGKENEKI